MAELDASGGLVTGYVLANGGIVSQTTGGASSHFFADSLGSTRALTDANGAVSDTYSYTAYGETYASSGSTSNSYLYAGQQYDSATGLYSMRARMYDPGVGRFVSRDTYPLNMQSPVEWNRYGYAAGDPVNGRDPSGYVALLDTIAGMWNKLDANRQVGAVRGVLVGFSVGAITAAVSVAMGCTSIGLTSPEYGAFITASAIVGAVTGGVLGAFPEVGAGIALYGLLAAGAAWLVYPQFSGVTGGHAARLSGVA